VKGVFKEHARNVSISSIKSNLGHTLGACGGIALVVCAKSLQNSVIPPTINLENPDPVCDLDYTPKTAREKSYRVAMSNSFGFGGHNASIVIGKLA
jgi:3-oxoacyl-[acyl-carrier-protein] synthase II